MIMCSLTKLLTKVHWLLLDKKRFSKKVRRQMIKDTAMKSHRLADSSGQKSHSFIFFSNTHKTLLMPTKMISEYIHIYSRGRR